MAKTCYSSIAAVTRKNAQNYYKLRSYVQKTCKSHTFVYTTCRFLQNMGYAVIACLQLQKQLTMINKKTI